MQKQPIDSWLVLIQEHHPGYINWQDYLENQTEPSVIAFWKSSSLNKSSLPYERSRNSLADDLAE